MAAPPAKTLEGRESQLIALAIDLAEHQLRTGVASPSTINHYLKLGSTREALELEKLRKENELLRAKAAKIDHGMEMEDVYEKIMAAMQSYSPTQVVDVDVEDV